MGKAKKKKTGKGGSQPSRPGSSTGGKAVNRNYSELEADLASLESDRRLLACNLLCELYSNAMKQDLDAAPLAPLTSNKILSCLVMRLVDSSVIVRCEHSDILHW